MGRKWEEFLVPGSFQRPGEGKIEFDFVQATDEFGATIDVQGLVNRDGEPIQWRARDSRRLEVVAVFFDDTYPDVMFKLLNAIESGGGEFVHPVYGAMQAVIQKGRVTHDSEEADSAMVSLSIIENADTDDLSFLPETVAGLANHVRDTADESKSAIDAFEDAADDAAAAIGSVSASIANAIDRATSLVDRVRAVADAIESCEDIAISVVELQSTVNGIIADQDLVLTAIADFDTPEAFDLSMAIQSNSAALRDLAEAAIESRPAVIDLAVKTPIPLLQWCHANNQDAGEILALNTIDDPLNLSVGTLRGYAE